MCSGRRRDLRQKRAHILNSCSPGKYRHHPDAYPASRVLLLLVRGKSIKVERLSGRLGKARRAAGPIRNKQMLDEAKPDLVIAFPGGTANTVRQVREAGVPVMVITVDV
jgi:hypothetical protein